MIHQHIFASPKPGMTEEEQLASLQSKEFIEGARIDEPRWAAFWNTLALVTDLAPWLGTCHGLPAVKDSFDVWAAHSEMLTFTPYQLIVDGDTTRTGQLGGLEND